jgi:hypothetical protein
LGAHNAAIVPSLRIIDGSDQRGRHVNVNRRQMFMVPLAGTTMLAEGTSAQGPYNFDPVALAKLRAGEIAREISGSVRDASVSEPSRDAVFTTGLLLQAGLRALLPIQERRDVALPGTPSSKDPPELIDAQENYKAVFASGREASPAQKKVALSAVESAAQQLSAEGYKMFSKAVFDWLRQQTRP